MAKSQAKIWENPLVPHALMLRMYEGMKELRALEPGSAALRKGARSLRGEEACRASSLLSLGTGDLLSDVPGSSAAAKPQSSTRTDGFGRLAPGTIPLPRVTDTLERLMLAVGAACALRAQGEGRLVLAYADGDALDATKWKQVLGAAGRAEAPIVFVLLPRGDGKTQGAISDQAQGWGVPGMPVDAADAVALYRVMQESVLRARGGDGPALAECVTWRLRAGEIRAADGIAAMRTLLTQRGLLLPERAPGTRKKARRAVG